MGYLSDTVTKEMLFRKQSNKTQSFNYYFKKKYKAFPI